MSRYRKAVSQKTEMDRARVLVVIVAYGDSYPQGIAPLKAADIRFMVWFSKRSALAQKITQPFDVLARYLRRNHIARWLRWRVSRGWW